VEEALAERGSDFTPFTLPASISDNTSTTITEPTTSQSNNGNTAQTAIPPHPCQQPPSTNTMSSEISSPHSHRFFKGVIFDPVSNNYEPWLESTYNVLGWNTLTRYAKPLKEGELPVKKEKPVGGTEAERELWEDKAEQAMVLIKESLGDHSWVIKSSETPSAAFKVMFDLYSGATKNDAVRLETQWVNETPVGDNFMEYIATMTALKDKLAKVGVTRSDKDMCLRMMAPLSEYPEGHPLREAFVYLNNKFKDDPDTMTLSKFTQFVQSTVEEFKNPISRRNVNRPTTKIEDTDDMRALAVLTKRVSELALAVANTRTAPANRNNASRRGTGTGTGLRDAVFVEIKITTLKTATIQTSISRSGNATGRRKTLRARTPQGREGMVVRAPESGRRRIWWMMEITMMG
jgi:hypothetical protein